MKIREFDGFDLRTREGKIYAVLSGIIVLVAIASVTALFTFVVSPHLFKCSHWQSCDDYSNIHKGGK